MIESIINNWATQRGAVANLEENDLKTLISTEMKTRARATVITAAHQRLCKLRTNRERENLLDRAEKKRAALAKRAARDARS